MTYEKVFQECEKFIDEHTSEELIKYEANLHLDYDKYSIEDNQILSLEEFKEN